MSEIKLKKGRVRKFNWPKGTNQEAWLKLRQEMSGDGDEEVVRLGASEVSVATGSNTFQCPQRLFHKLTGYYKKDFINETTVAGHLQEPVIAQRWEGFVPDDLEQSLHNAVNGVRLRKLAKAKFFLTNDLYPYLSVSLDYVPSGVQYSPFTGEKYPRLTPNEMKHTNAEYYKLWPDGIARPYLEQVNIQMLVSGTTLAVFHVLIDGKNYKVMEIERDDDLLAEMLPKIEAFVEKVKKGKRLLSMMREMDDDRESEVYKMYESMYQEITPEAIGMEDNLELAYEMNEYTDKAQDDQKQATDADIELMLAYLEQGKVIKEAEANKVKFRTLLVQSCGKWQGMWSPHAKMINRRAAGDKKAFFKISAVSTK